MRRFLVVALFFLLTITFAQGAHTLSPPLGDCDGDGEIGLLDYGIAVAFFNLSVSPGTQCDFDQDGIVSLTEYSIIVTNFGQTTTHSTCFIGGCNSEICSDQPDVPSPCIFRPEFACYQHATCEVQTHTGQCGWTLTNEYHQCLANLSPTPTPPVVGTSAGIWIDSDRLASLPTSGPGWNSLTSAASGNAGSTDLSNQDSNTNVNIMAKALVHARTGNQGYLNEVLSGLDDVCNGGTYSGRALALGRELAAYPISADLINLAQVNPTLHNQCLNKFEEYLTTPTGSGPGSLTECQEDRPNNWGTMCGGSRIAVAAYIAKHTGDRSELDEAARVFRGWTGETQYYNGFSFGNLSWQCDESNPVGVNPAGCIKNGNDVSGSMPDDNRRCGGPMCKSGYGWEGYQGVAVAGVILHQMGIDPWGWGQSALCRVPVWTTEVLDFPASDASDDIWATAITDYYCGTNLWNGSDTSGAHGKIAGWTTWTHQ